MTTLAKGHAYRTNKNNEELLYKTRIRSTMNRYKMNKTRHLN